MATFVQTAVSPDDETDVVTSATFGVNVTAGNTLFVVVNVNNPGSYTLADTLGNSFTLIQTQNTTAPFNNEYMISWYVKNALGGADTITFTGSPPTPINGRVVMMCAEIGGLDPTAPLVSMVQSQSGPGSFSLNDSLGTTWTIDYAFLSSPPFYGAVDFTGFGTDMLLFYSNAVFGDVPTTSAPVIGSSTLIESVGTFISNELWQMTATPNPYLAITCGSPPNGSVGTPYSFTFPAAGGAGSPTYTFAIMGTLPPGLTLNATTGTISGTPTALGLYPFSVSVSLTGSTGFVTTVSTCCAIGIAPPGTGGNYGYAF